MLFRSIIIIKKNNNEIGSIILYVVIIIFFSLANISLSMAMQPFGQVPAFEDGDLKLFGKSICNW